MATEQDQEQERLDRILIRVKAGARIRDAVRDEHCHHWYYRVLNHKRRLPIVAAARENQEKKRQETRLDAERTTPPWIHVETYQQRKQDFQAVCDHYGVSISSRINTLMAQDIMQFKAGI